MNAVRKIAIVGAVLAAAGGVLWWLRPLPLAVDVAVASHGPLQVTIDDLGETRTHDRFVVSAPVAGQLSRIALHDGDAVSVDQVLARIEPLPLSVREAGEVTGRVSAAEALLRSAQQQLHRSQTQLAQQRRDHQRVARLAVEGFLPRQQAEQAAAAEAVAVAETEAAESQVRAAAADLKVARAALPALQSSAPVAVRAPMAGRVLRVVDPNERVVAAGAPLMSLGDLGQLEAVIEVLSTEAVRVRPGMPVLLEGLDSSRTLHAVVRRVEPFAFTKVSALGVEEKRVYVVAEFVDAPAGLGDGFRLTGRIVVWESDDVLKIPVSALLRCADQWCAFVVELGRAALRTLQIGRRNLSEAEVLDGLTSGDQVIRFAGNDLKPGLRVTPRHP